MLFEGNFCSSLFSLLFLIKILLFLSNASHSKSSQLLVQNVLEVFYSNLRFFLASKEIFLFFFNNKCASSVVLYGRGGDATLNFGNICDSTMLFCGQVCRFLIVLFYLSQLCSKFNVTFFSFPL